MFIVYFFIWFIAFLCLILVANHDTGYEKIKYAFTTSIITAILFYCNFEVLKCPTPWWYILSWVGISVLTWIQLPHIIKKKRLEISFMMGMGFSGIVLLIYTVINHS